MRWQKKTGSLATMNCHASPVFLVYGLLSCLNNSYFGVPSFSASARRHCIILVIFLCFFTLVILNIGCILDFFTLSSFSLSNWLSFTLTITSTWMISESAFLTFLSLLKTRLTVLSVYGVSLAGCSPRTWNASNSKLNLTSSFKHIPPQSPIC